MKRKEEIRGEGDRRRETEDGSWKHEVGSRKTGAGLWVSWFLTAIIEVRIGTRATHAEELSFAVDFNQRNKDYRSCRSESATPTEINSTVFHKTRSSASSPSADGGKASRLERKGGQQLELTPVIIDFLHEKLAIRACDLLRFFNN